MQIIQVWLKITALLAFLGWGAHTFSPDFARWVDGFFSAKTVIDTAADAKPPARPAPTGIAPRADKPVTKTGPHYKFND